VPVYGPFDTVGTVQELRAAVDTARVRIGFDMHLPEAGDGFSVRVNGQSVIEGASRWPRPTPWWIGGASPGSTRCGSCSTVPATPCAGGGGSPGPNAAWAIDNVSVVASGRTS
jgi:hypothetical protein